MPSNRTNVGGEQIPFEGNAIGIIPARLDSTRFPNKPLALIAGVPLICWTLKRSRQAKFLKDVFVAAQDQKIVDAVLRWGGQVKLIRGDFRTGSDRVASAAQGLDVPVVVNIQADEPLLDPLMIDQALQMLEERPELGITTIVRPLSDVKDYLDPNCVKVVMREDGGCLYFSRAPIPMTHQVEATNSFPDDIPIRHHVGIYCYRQDALRRFAKLPTSALERCEGLEQLRFIEFGGAIGAIEVAKAGPSINTVEDLRLAEEYITENNITFESTA